jgi:hypothetical protein
LIFLAFFAIFAVNIVFSGESFISCGPLYTMTQRQSQGAISSAKVSVSLLQAVVN